MKNHDIGRETRQSTPGWRLHERVRKRQVALVRKLNDHYIFVSQALPLIDTVKARHERSSSRRDRKYPVPSRGRARVVRRTDAELTQLFGSFIDRDLLGTLIIATVSHVESFLFDTLRVVLREYPQKLGVGRSAEGQRQVPLATILNSQSLADLVESVIDTHLRTLSYATPRDYLAYFQQITGVRTDDLVFSDFVEIKATRDLLVHNSGIVNDVYLAKAGSAKRARLGQTIPVNKDYFDHSIITLKRITVLVSDGIRTTFTRRSHANTEMPVVEANAEQTEQAPRSLR